MERLFTRRGFNVIVLFLDLVIIFLSIFISYIYYKDNLAVPQESLSAVITMCPYIGLFYLIIGHVFELDKPKEFTLFGVAYMVIVAVLCLFMLTMAMSFFTQKMFYPRSIMVSSSVIQIILLTAWHLFINKKFLKENTQKSVLVVGYNKAKDIARQLLNSKSMWSNIQKICKPESTNLQTYIEEYDIIFICEDVDENVKQNLAEECAIKRKEFFYEPRYQELFLFNASFIRIDDTPVLKTRPFDIDHGSDMMKRILDVFLALIAGIVFLIPALLVIIALKIGGGSVLYRQERVTQDCRPFYIYKFRTMIENAEATSGPVLANDSDSRITKLGRFLRATRLDEIPQIYNILAGDMSIVGPRPERPFFVERYAKEIPEYNLRHRVKAGLTGLAQVQGKYNTPVREKLKYDLLYINSHSLALDIKLIMQTLTILLKKSSTEGVREWESHDELLEKITEKEVDV